MASLLRLLNIKCSHFHNIELFTGHKQLQIRFKMLFNGFILCSKFFFYINYTINWGGGAELKIQEKLRIQGQCNNLIKNN